MASLLIVNTLSELVRNIQCFGAIFVWKLKNEINIAQHTKNQITNNSIDRERKGWIYLLLLGCIITSKTTLKQKIPKGVYFPGHTFSVPIQPVL